MEQHEHGHQQQQAMHPSFLNVIKQKERIKNRLSNIKHKIGVYSAKGGVGKTTIAVNIAYMLSKRGFKVGLLDADIDCPNISLFLGTEDKIEPVLPLVPIEVHGMKVASTAMVVDDQQRPIIWRGPIIAKMLGDFFENTEWGALDYLILDLAPGTSDTALTIMQLLDLDGFVIVTNPQRIAAVNAIRSGLMARRMSSNVLGVIENMSDGQPSDNTTMVVDKLSTLLLGSVKRDAVFNSCSDNGEIAAMKSQHIASMFSDIVDKLVS